MYLAVVALRVRSRQSPQSGGHEAGPHTRLHGGRPESSVFGEDFAELGLLIGGQVAGDQFRAQPSECALDPVGDGVGAEEEQRGLAWRDALFDRVEELVIDSDVGSWIRRGRPSQLLSRLRRLGIRGLERLRWWLYSGFQSLIVTPAVL